MDSARQAKIDAFDPNGVGLKNGHFIGLPFTEEEAQLIYLGIPWDVTVSYREGTSGGPGNILEASAQLDLIDPDVPQAWHIGHYFRPSPDAWLTINNALRQKSRRYIDFLENGGDVADDHGMARVLEEINAACAEQVERVANATAELLDAGKWVGLIGGDHSSPLGYLRSLAERHQSFGILQIDAHMDLRQAYEGFTYSHASIFYNALQLPAVGRLVQVGIRDYCEEEFNLAKEQNDRVHVWYEQDRQEALMRGETWHELCGQIIADLPAEVYLSFDIDGLRPDLCPNTGTPVPGGLTFYEAIYLIRQVVQSGRTIIGFDLCETAGPEHDWDGNVAARLAWRLGNLCALSQGWKA